MRASINGKFVQNPVNRWTVRARVTNKSSIRTWSNSRGDGKLFSMEIVDESVSNIIAPLIFGCVTLVLKILYHLSFLFLTIVFNNVLAG